MLTLTTPWMLAGLAALALPLAAHLMHRHAQRRIIFPTIELLAAAAASQARLFRLRRLILLALRCLMVAFVALAFSRPLWRDRPADAASAGKAEGVALLVDASASTRQTHGGVTLFSRLQGAAARSLDSLRQGVDAANVVFADAQPRASLPRLSRNLPALREDLLSAAPSYERGDLRGALALAGRMLADHDGPRRLIVLSDLQAENWREVLEGAFAREALPRDVEITIVDPAAPAPGNVGISAPRVAPAEPLAGQPAQLVAQLANDSPDSAQAQVRILLDGQPIASQTVTLAAGERREVAFEALLDDTRVRQAVFQLGPDGADFDNRAFLAVQARRSLPVAILSDDDPDDPGTAAYYLMRALAPHGEGGDNRFEPRHVSSRALRQGALDESSVVFVGYLSPLSRDQGAAIVDYVRRGGAAALLLGEGAVAANLAQLDAAAGESGAAPWEVGAARRLDPRSEPLEISSGSWRSPLLRAFDEQSQIALRSIRLRHIWQILRVRPDSEILLTYSDNTPAMALRRLGEGRLLAANFTPATAGGDLAKHAAFVALTQALAKELRPPKALLAGAAPGLPYRHPTEFDLSGAAPIQVVGPDGKEVPALATELDSGKTAFQLQRPALPGFYRFEQDGELLDVAAINVDSRESDLTRLDAAALGERLRGAAVQAASSDAPAWTFSEDRHGRPLWGWMFALAMTFIGVELLLVGLWRR